MDNMTDIIEVAVYASGYRWKVGVHRNGFEEDKPIRCRTKAEAIKKARTLFNATPTAKRLIAENGRDFYFQTIRER